MSQPVLVIDRATRRFGNACGLDRVELRLEPGEWVALLGRNGAGKSTLMRAVAGRVRLDEGRIRVFGQPAGSVGARGLIGVVPQRTAVYPALSVAENLAIFARAHAVHAGRRKAAIARVLEWMNLADRASQPAGELSGGMQRRLNIGCGILHEPRLVLLDEPTAGLDVGSRRQIHALLGDLRDKGTTILESTHEMDAVEASCDRVVIMQAGRLLASGSVASLARAGRVTEHWFRITLSHPVADLRLPAHARACGRTITGRLQGVEAELAELLGGLSEAGASVLEIAVEPPHLEDVFVQFTGSGPRS